jgi:ketosteroid isomerase-like protein
MFPNDPQGWRPVEAASPPPAVQPARTTRRWSVAASLVIVALFSALIGFAVDRFVTTNLSPTGAPPIAAAAPTTIPSVPRIGPVAAPNGGSPTATPSTTTTPTADPAVQAVQQVIQRGDEEQAQALAGNDPSVMADTSTPDFYQVQVQTNQDLAANGVTAIKLVNIEWGPVSVSGTTATATAWETWTTSYSDGTSEQSRDRNVYTLVQDNGAWKVSADDHPDEVQALTPGTGTTPGGAANPGGTGTGRGTGTGTGNPSTGLQPQPSQPRVPRGQDTSQNWSGYSATGGTFTAVSGTWSVPQFTPDSPAGADAAWVGIGGVNTRDLIQAGTQQTVSGSGSTQYQAWVETLPQASHPVPLAIHSGDSVSVSISLVPQTQNRWLVAFHNNTTGQTYQVTETYSSSMSSAEWIQEAPSAARGRQIALDNFGTIDFSQGSAVKDGQTVSIAGAGAQAVTMVGRGGQRLATPSALGSDGASFTVTRN